MAHSFEMADKQLHGELEHYLAKWYGEGDSFDTMTINLNRMGVAAGREQVRRWCIKAGLHQTGKERERAS